MPVKRVVVTGLGLVTPLGVGVGKNWLRLVSGESSLQSTTKLGNSFTILNSRVAGWPPEDELLDFQRKNPETQSLPKYIKYALLATDEAIIDSGIDFFSLGVEECGGVSIGCGMAPLDLVGDSAITLQQKGPRRVSPHLIPRILPNMASGHVSIKLGLKGPLLAPSTACAAGANAIGDAFRLIRHGYAKVMIAGGTEAAINPLSIAGFSQARALSTHYNDEPVKSSRPFDRNRDGFVLGEGSGILVLEERNFAIERGAKIYGEIKGYGCSADANHITAPNPDGRGAESAMRAALKEAELLPEQINHVNAHATSTPIGDLAELCALRRLFSSHLPPVTSNKGSIGHLLGAAGAVESIFTLLSIREGIIPPTLNFEAFSIDGPEIDLVFGKSRPIFLRAALCNSFGFGGTNVSLCYVNQDY